MAILIPSMEQIKESKPHPEEGELEILRVLQNGLDDSYHIFFQSYLNGLHPDVVILKDGYGVFIIEVKDWEFKHYRYEDHNEMDNKNKKYGRMFLNKNNCEVKTPFDQVMAYKNSLYNLYIPKLQIENAKNSKNYGFVKVGVYFYNESSESVDRFFESKSNCTQYISKWGRNSSIIEEIERKLSFKSPLNDEIYLDLHTLLTPAYHTANEGKDIKLTNQQLKLTRSEAGLETKVRGVAGCGKSTLLAHKAVNVIKRKNVDCRVLILSFNITLKNYLRDKISAIREDFAWTKFNIIHFHGFMMQVSDEDNVEIKGNDGKIDFDNLDVGSFKNKISNRNKYDAILIDEGQDFKKAWFDILKQNFLKEDGEFLIMADEKQNIYDTELDNDRKVITNIKGNWNNLTISHRMGGKLRTIAKEFQKAFYKDKYELDKFTEEQISMDLEEQDILYNYGENVTYEEIFGEVNSYAHKNRIHFNNICILASEIGHLRALEFNIRNKYNIQSEIMFETEEEYEELKKNGVLNLEDKIKDIRRCKKFGFNNNSGKLKICTTHSFKGWESETLVLIIDNMDKKLTDELLYTAITRCKKNFIIYNRGNEMYHRFFKNVV